MLSFRYTLKKWSRNKTE